MSITVKVNSQRFRDLLKRTPGMINDGLNVTVNQVGIDFERRFKKDRMKRSADAIDGLRTRTGNLSQKFTRAVISEGNTRTLALGFSGVPYARIHEFGGTIRPKRAKWLTIPVGPALTASGVARGPARSFEGLTLLIPKGLNRSPMLGKWKPVGETLTQAQVSDRLATRNVYQGLSTNFSTGKSRAAIFVPYFILKKKVTLKPRLGFYSYHRAYFAPKGPWRAIVERGVQRTLRALNRKDAPQNAK